MNSAQEIGFTKWWVEDSRNKLERLRSDESENPWPNETSSYRERRTPRWQQLQAGHGKQQTTTLQCIETPCNDAACCALCQAAPRT
ncbi:hypothetical protein ACLKA6_015673 [Drosophila palustris]